MRIVYLGHSIRGFSLGNNINPKVPSTACTVYLFITMNSKFITLTAFLHSSNYAKALILHLLARTLGVFCQGNEFCSIQRQFHFALFI